MTAPAFFEFANISAECAITIGDHCPVRSFSVIADHISLAVTIDIVPFGGGTSMTTPSSLEFAKIFLESTITIGKLCPVGSMWFVITDNIYNSITIKISKCGMGTIMTTEAKQECSEVSER